jgi:hypothetical protein
MPLTRKRRLPLVSEADATGRILEIYEEIKSDLGVPHVNLIFQAYAACPRFLELMWTMMRPVVATQEFFATSYRLGAEAYTATHNYFSVPDLCEHIRTVHFSTGAQHEITDVVELFHYNNPLLLLIAAVQMQAFEDGPAHPRAADAGASHPVFTQRPIRITEDAAPPPIRRIYEDMKRTLGLAYVNTDFQAFARWPDFFSVYWNGLKPVLTSPLYSESKHTLRESALAFAVELPNAPQLSLDQAQEFGIDHAEMTVATHITEEFLDALSGLLLNIAFAKIALEGGNLRGESRRAIPIPTSTQTKPSDRAA